MTIVITDIRTGEPVRSFNLPGSTQDATAFAHRYSDRVEQSAGKVYAFVTVEVTE